MAVATTRRVAVGLERKGWILEIVQPEQSGTWKGAGNEENSST